MHPRLQHSLTHRCSWRILEQRIVSIRPKAPKQTLDFFKWIAWFLPARPNMTKTRPGFSQMDWIRRMRREPAIGAKGFREDITMEEVRLHHTHDDAWMVFNGMVYNITPYMDFHPGGADMLMKVAGKDGHALFMKQHPYVNLQGLLNKCLVGRIALDPIQAKARQEIEEARRARELIHEQQQEKTPAEDDSVVQSSETCNRDGGSASPR